VPTARAIALLVCGITREDLSKLEKCCMPIVQSLRVLLLKEEDDNRGTVARGKQKTDSLLAHC